ncbi:phosphocholine cytidylyltransferase family protein [Hellea sp.]|nr:phosphocholine cytidylyltransferase family protein [Hellea sp.]
MHAIILSAGRGSRLLPLTTDLPKCLLPVGLTSVLSLQLDTLFRHGIKTATVVTGFNEHLVQEEIDSRKTGPEVKALYNPFFQVADNLASCWMAREYMKQDFLLINGDTLFTPELLEQVLSAPAKDITVTIDKKGHYDGDDMKVSLDGDRLTAIGKTLLPQQTDGESIGMLRFMNDGTKIFRNELERLMRLEEGTKSWFLSAIHGLAQSGQRIDTTNIQGSTWAELDTPEDYEICRELFGNSEMARQRFTAV